MASVSVLVPLRVGLLADQWRQRVSPLPPPPHQLAVLRALVRTGVPPRRPPLADGVGRPLRTDVLARPIVVPHRLDRFHGPVVPPPLTRVPPPVPLAVPLRPLAVAPVAPRLLGVLLVRVPLLPVQPRVEGGVAVRALGLLSPRLLLLLRLLLPYVATVLEPPKEEAEVLSLLSLAGPAREPQQAPKDSVPQLCPPRPQLQQPWDEPDQVRRNLPPLRQPFDEPPDPPAHLRQHHDPRQERVDQPIERPRPRVDALDQLVQAQLELQEVDPRVEPLRPRPEKPQPLAQEPVQP